MVSRKAQTAILSSADGEMDGEIRSFDRVLKRALKKDAHSDGYIIISSIGGAVLCKQQGTGCKASYDCMASCKFKGTNSKDSV